MVRVSVIVRFGVRPRVTVSVRVGFRSRLGLGLG